MARLHGFGELPWPLRCLALAPVLFGVCLVIFDSQDEALGVSTAERLRSDGQSGARRGLRALDGDRGFGADRLLVAVSKNETSPDEPDDFKHRYMSGRQKVNVIICFVTGMAIMVAMALVNSHNATRAETLKGAMKSTLSADRYILQMLKQFSVKAVEEYILQGINVTKQQVDIEFEDLSTSIRTRSFACNKSCGTVEEKAILTGVSGEFKAGRVAAIMGTSGAGKTTFLNLLCGKIGSMGNWHVAGSIKVNGSETKLESLKPMIGFVPQDDIVHDRMTVRENIWFSAKLRNPSRTSSGRLHRITNDVLQVLQLEAQQNRQVGNRATGGGLSGGQRKRVNVGLELAACPTLLFLDEPTSGLDATGSLMLVRTLQKMTQLGMTIIMVIHQPRYTLFTLIDDVLLLGKGGRTCFFGPTDQAKTYFERLGFVMPPNENPADWMMDVLSGQGYNANDKFRQEELPEVLFDAWVEHKKQVRPMVVSRQESLGTRVSSDNEECLVITAHVMDAWKRVDPPATTALSASEFCKVLGNCAGSEPEHEVVAEIMHRIVSFRRSPGTQKKSTQDVYVTHREFEQFLHRVYKGTYVGASSTQDLSGFEMSMLEEEDEEDDDAGDVSTAERTCSSDSYDTSGDDADEEQPIRATPNGTRQGAQKRARAMQAMKKHKSALPGFFSQLDMFARRTLLLWWRQQTMRLMFLLVVEFAGLFLGIFDRFIFENPPWMAINYMNAQISLALLTSVYCLRTFGSAEELPIFWRECSHGLNRAAYFTARSLIDTLDMFLMCFGFATAYYIVVVPKLVFGLYVVPFMFVTSVSCSWGYLISCWLPYELNSLGPFVSALLSFVFGGILGLPNEMGVYLGTWYYQLVVSCISFTRWGVPMIFFAYIDKHPVSDEMMDMGQRYQYHQLIDDYRQGWRFSWDETYWWTGIFSLTCTALVLRALAFVGLCVSNRSKMV